MGTLFTVLLLFILSRNHSFVHILNKNRIISKGDEALPLVSRITWGSSIMTTFATELPLSEHITESSTFSVRVSACPAVLSKASFLTWLLLCQFYCSPQLLTPCFLISSAGSCKFYAICLSSMSPLNAENLVADSHSICSGLLKFFGGLQLLKHWEHIRYCSYFWLFLKFAKIRIYD